MLRTLYNALWYPAAPLIRRYLRRRAQLSPAYLEHWNERFGGAYPNPVQRPIWIHAVSVGETRAAAPLAAELQARFPDAPLLFTQMTPPAAPPRRRCTRRHSAAICPTTAPIGQPLFYADTDRASAS